MRVDDARDAQWEPVARGRSVVGGRIPGTACGAFTLIELLVVITIISILIGILLPSLGQARNIARALKDSTQVRGVIQCMVIWAQHNRDDYPMPSQLDKADATVNAPGAPFEKDNTGNILSVMIYNQFIQPQLLRSPAEVSDRIAIDEGYQYDDPPQALDPAGAVWDPGFAGVPDETGTAVGHGRRGPAGGTSYAHVPPFGKRRRLWTSTYNSTEAVLANRGPIFGGGPGQWVLAPGAYGEQSNTLLIHGTPRRWEGNVGFNDGRVVYESQPDPPGVTWTFTGLTQGNRTLRDNLFVNEHDDDGTPDAENYVGRNGNLFLRAYFDVQAAGSGTPEDAVVTPMWD